MEGNTATLRSSAAQWSLAGDKQLLDILNNIHQSLVTRCQEVNKKLDEMVSALDGASVDLQNVNNKFMALSNSQFIESRVYDDDVDIATQEPPKEAPKQPSSGEDITTLKHSVATLVAAHETIEILASDSDDDDEDEARMVLKPKDMYAHRPLPYIIGSQSWRNKWHAGLHPEESDSDSSISKRDREDEDYSDSEPEMSSQPAAPLEREESTASSELPSEQDIGSASVPSAGIKPAPADIAAELARRLGGQHVQIPFQEPEYTPPNPATRKVYRPEQPMPGTIFSDEPPPLDQSDRSDSPEDDIFAELHKSQPYAHGNKEQSRLAEDLFAGLGGYEEGDVFSDFKDSQLSSTPTPKQKSTLFEDESEPESFEKPPKPAPRPDVSKPEVDNVKKPIGGISLFGNTKGAESIGAAILRRNRQKSSSDEETVEETVKKQETRATSKEKDIFDDLFAKSEKEQKRNTKKIVEKAIKEVETPQPKVDLFSDNIFDDIDDIFTTNITKTVKNDKNNEKSLFDDDDNIFSDIAVSKTSDNSKVDSKIIVDKKKSIFDSDDDLFSEIPNKENKEITKMENSNKETKSNLFENGNEDIYTKSDIKNDNVTVNTDRLNEITSNEVLINNHNSTKNNDNLNNIINPPLEKEAVNIVRENYNSKSAAKSIFDDDDDDGNDYLCSSIATKSSRSENKTVTTSQSNKIKEQNSSLFDDDSDDNDLFGTKLPEPDKNNKHSIQNNDVPRNDEIKTDLNQKTSLFDDMETDDMFGNPSKQSNIENKTLSNNQNKTPTKESQPIDNRKESLFDDEEEALFRDSNKKPVQYKPKPELMKKPTIAPRNNNNGAKKLDENKNIDQKEKIKQENIVKDTNYDSQDKQSSNVLEQDIFGSKANEQRQLHVKQDKINLNEDKIESQLTSTETNINPLIQNKLGVQEEKIEPSLPVIKKSVADIPKQSNLNPKHKRIESILPENDIEMPPPFEATDNDDDIFADHPIDSRTKTEQISTPNVFDDIFSEPPAFEKPKEPKKSKNINALFDDDSDDEALFFKKNDPIIDEKPDLSPDTSREALFGIFHDEPPAIEVDFSQNPSKSNINDDFLKSDLDDDLFSTPKIQQKDALDSVPKTEFGTIDNEHTRTTEINTVEKLEITEKPQIEKPNSSKESQREITDEPKKVGRLKTMNFNIDVSTLLPGASPKKKVPENLDPKSREDTHEKKNNKSLEQIDGQTFTKSSEDLRFKEKIEPLMAKSVSFEGEPDSQVLDNKISKERAKIQVKRRPSTRRARKEAVRKSAIDFGDDSTDNSSSIDDPPKKPNVEQRTTIDSKELEKIEVKLPKTDDYEDVILKTESDKVETDKIQTKSEVKVPEEKPLGRSSDEVDFNEKTSDNFEPNIRDSDDILENITNKEEKQSTVDLEPEIKHLKPKTLEEKPELKLDSPKTTKIVYILNDEDIFSNPVERNEVKSTTIDDDDQLFKSNVNTSKTTEVIPNISTLGSVYKDSSNIENKTSSKISEKHKKSLFEDLSDDDNELFNTNKKTTTQSKSILDSDSEEDLFGGKKKETKDTKATIVKERENTKVEVRSSLFGDEDDDDLFGAKVKTIPASSAQPSRSTREVTTKPAEPVFNDPLSLLGGDDD